MNLVRFHPEAESEMIDAAVWYETQQENLGKRFLTSVQDAINRIQLHPELYPVVEADVRRCLTKTFPFGVLFRIKPGIIAIMAVMHLHRDPDCWKNRRFEPDGPVNPAKPRSGPPHLPE
jgi:toxin ParE1/3/4